MKSQKGFTLFELIFAVIWLFIITGSVWVLFHFISKFW